MTPIERMLAEHEIARLVVQYARLNDEGDFAALADLFCEDGVFIRPSGGDPVVGRAAILRAYEGRPPRIARHLVANIAPEILDENTAVCRSAILLYAALAGDLPTAAAGPGLLGGFADKLVHTDECWRFAERRGFVDLKIGMETKS